MNDCNGEKGITIKEFLKLIKGFPLNTKMYTSDDCNIWKVKKEDIILNDEEELIL